ncbi:MAG TPA: hypothetical protein VFX49_20260, partial [Chloroflexota bacterium]|nr:hypothetical protein [Chloroflexota bacterium]
MSVTKPTSMTAVDAGSVPAFLAALDDRPETVVVRHLLLRGWGSAHVAGAPHAFDAAVVESTLGEGAWPAGEPTGLGNDPESLWAVLRTMRDWDCVVVEEACAETLGTLIQQETGRAVHLYP